LDYVATCKNIPSEESPQFEDKNTKITAINKHTNLQSSEACETINYQVIVIE